MQEDTRRKTILFLPKGMPRLLASFSPRDIPFKDMLSIIKKVNPEKEAIPSGRRSFKDILERSPKVQ